MDGRDHGLPIEPATSEIETPRPPRNAEAFFVLGRNLTPRTRLFLSCSPAESWNNLDMFFRRKFCLTLAERFRNFRRVRISSLEVCCEPVHGSVGELEEIPWTLPKCISKSTPFPQPSWRQESLMHLSEGTPAEVGPNWGGSRKSRSVSAPTRGYYSTKEVAALLLVDVTTIRRWADAGKLRCFRTPGGHRRFTQAQVSNFIQKYQYELA